VFREHMLKVCWLARLLTYKQRFNRLNH
jgi:hypothetical protein